MKKKKTQLLGIVLSAAMLATSVPAPVYAEPTDNVAEEEDSDAAAVQETTDEADAVADDATDDSTAADDATPEEADEQDTADEADAQAAEEGDNEVKVDGGYTISIPTINFQGANAAVAEQMAKDVEIDESDPAIQSLRKALEEVEIVGGEAGTESNESNISTADLYEADEADGQETTQKLTDEQIDEFIRYLGRHIGADRIYIFEDCPKKNITKNTYEWCADGVKPEIDNLQNVPMELIGWWYDLFEQKKTSS